MFQIGFQSNAFQTVRTQTNTDSTGALVGKESYYYQTPYQKYKIEESQRKLIADEKAKLAAVDKEIAEAEAQRLLALETLADKKKAKAKAALEAKLQAEISRLRTERIWLIQRIKEEEATLVILMVMKRRRLRAV